ncbi:molybdenum cofactor guanylyltransferase MobA [Pseudomonas segetis]|uniref:Molybdenum cofactor guanylyltransferase n=1 Tax=Pseudomonas segetis TaxID=298908 RepID=A0A238ZZL2_9PSED|nr:molybdenum cofactor guanylyltransferase MobA [Pseudomonas segetis]SNR88592.1 molybdenum cofactor guanylyltransferase [Pseudomonas segetis]
MSTPSPINACSILLLAGGRGQRMGGRDKGLVLWHERPLIAWLHDLVRPLSDDLIISCNRNQAQYAAYADQVVADDDTGFQGPLAGIRAGLKVARHPYMLVLPCDAPMLDRALLTDLMMLAGDAPAVVRQGQYLEPLFSVIPCWLRSQLENAWLAGERSPQRWLRSLDPRPLVCPDQDARLANMNTPELLDTSKIKQYHGN